MWYQRKNNEVYFMIWGLEFDRYWESKEYHTEAHSAMLSIYDIFRRRNIPCFLLYRYKLPNLEFEWINPVTINTKFGTKRTDDIDFSKIYSKYVIIYHIDVFEENPNRLKDFLTYCNENKIDVFIPIISKFKSIFKSKYWNEIKDILKDFEINIYKIKELEDEFRIQKLIERDLKINDLLN